MGYIIEVTEDKVDMLSENIEKALRYAGKAMQCIDEMSHGGYGERGRYGERDDEDWDDEERMGERGHYDRMMREERMGRGMGMRRRRDSRGRYM